MVNQSKSWLTPDHLLILRALEQWHKGIDAVNSHDELIVVSFPVVPSPYLAELTRGQVKNFHQNLNDLILRGLVRSVDGTVLDWHEHEDIEFSRPSGESTAMRFHWPVNLSDNFKIGIRVCDTWEEEEYESSEFPGYFLLEPAYEMLDAMRPTPNQDPDIPEISDTDGLWVTTKSAASIEGLTPHTLRTYRTKGKKSGDGMSGIDLYDRKWRRKGNPTSNVRYYLPSLKNKKK